jgi:murein DD-endopeptidase MepM/ murein hydrolase activator NlpD
VSTSVRNGLPGAALASACSLVLVFGASAGSSAGSSAATARAWAVKIIVPGATDLGSAVASAPPDAVGFGGPFTYPADGSIVKVASSTTNVSAAGGQEASASATAQLSALTLFGGEITADGLTGEMNAVASAAGAGGTPGASGVKNLVVLGEQISVTPNRQIPLGTWGTATALEETGAATAQGEPGFHGFTVALDVLLTASHDGLPAGSQIQLGYAEVTVQASAPAPAPVTTTSTSTGRSRVTPPGKASTPPTATPRLGGTDYVFPVYGASSFGDTFGVSRPGVPGGWHRGDDIFAPLGTPALAVAHGTVFSVGYERVGGWRLWLRDDLGNEFYYAHLAAYTPLAVNGAIVQAGDVLGFVGNTGRADGGSYHLHFEIHPVGLLGLGEEGAVDPTAYLRSWRHAQNARLVAAAGWALPLARGRAPKAGALVLQGTDISAASGLDPAALGRILNAPAIVGR